MANYLQGSLFLRLSCLITTLDWIAAARIGEESTGEVGTGRPLDYKLRYVFKEVPEERISDR